MSEWWSYENLEPAPEGGYDWHPAGRNDHPDDQIDYHIDLGAGRLPKGRLRIDRHGDAEVLMDLNTLQVFKFGDRERPPMITSTSNATGVHYKEEDLVWVERKLPFPDDSIESMISHHCLEHIGPGYLRLMDECFRVLKPGGKFRIIVPLFPSMAAVSDPDHVRYFGKDTFESFCAVPNTQFWSDSFAEPYTKARFQLTAKDYTPPRKFPAGEVLDIDMLFEEPREIRVTLTKHK
jgi:SAM-dependent methyltransferase